MGAHSSRVQLGEGGTMKLEVAGGFTSTVGRRERKRGGGETETEIETGRERERKES